MLSRFRKFFADRIARRKTAPAAGGAPEPPPELPAPAAPEEADRVLPAISLADIDPDAIKVVRRLVRHSHTAYLVGGCVRDLLLGRRPKDFDISTSATPREIKSLFRNSRIIGRRFKLAHVFFRPPGGEGREKIIEVSTFRALQEEGEDGDDLLIRRDNVFGTPEEDARRRDFTVNALFYDLEAREVIDHASGLPDLHRGLLRTIGDPDIRLREDPVRILRAIKFAARLDFKIEPATLAAMRAHRADIPRCPAPRILEELLRILRSGSAVSAFALLGESRVLEVLLPEIDQALARDLSRVELYHGILAEFDRRVAAGDEIDAAVLLASLFLPLMPWQGEAGPGGLDLPGAVTAVFAPVAERLRVSRRDSDAVRRILLSIRKMVPGYRAKRFSRSGLARR
ncbi:MAG: polynucleotide adenylyltransferase PcnB, partial [Acidobacteriota bacterium]